MSKDMNKVERQTRETQESIIAWCERKGFSGLVKNLKKRKRSWTLQDIDRLAASIGVSGRKLMMFGVVSAELEDELFTKDQEETPTGEVGHV